MILRYRFFSKLLFTIACLSLLFVPARAGEPASAEAEKLLPKTIGDFRAQGAVQLLTENSGAEKPAEIYRVLSSAARTYRSPQGQTLIVRLYLTASDSAAYALLTGFRMAAASDGPAANPQATETAMPAQPVEIGTVAFAAPGRIGFFKGNSFVEISRTNQRSPDDAEMFSLARSLAETLDKGDEDIPVLVKHLPEWESARERAVYAVTSAGLRDAAAAGIGEATVVALDAVDFSGGTEAVVAAYGSMQLVLVEYTTPQLATAADVRILERLKQLGASGQPRPSAYKRVGNYSVFVFNAPDEATAAQLIEQVNYEKVVQWLGLNPRMLERAQREYTQTTGGVILTVVKSTGLSLLICLGIGALFGALIFRRRRAQQSQTDAYSDAGGMLRLNLDEMTPQTDGTRLLSKSDG